MEVDRVFAGDDVSDGAALGLAGGLLGGGHFCETLAGASSAQLRAKVAAVAQEAANSRLAVYVLTEIGCGLVDGEIEMRREVQHFSKIDFRGFA